MLSVGGKQVPTIVDTGSIYLFVGTEGNDAQLTCTDPSVFHYGGTYATFCKDTMPLRAVGVDASVVDLASEVTMGRAKFTEFEPPYAIIGLSANLEGKNLGGLTPITEQLQPDYLSFQFPSGPQNNGIVRFAALPGDELQGVPSIPLVSPGGLEYGYTAKVSRVDFIADDSIRATIKTERDGVYLDRDLQHTKIAETNLAFFDTGATPPYVALNGDISLLGDHVTEAMLPFAGPTPFDRIQFTFDLGDGDHVVLSSPNMQSYAPGPFLTLPSPSDFPAGLKQLTSVVGLGTLAGYDFQFTFKDNRATTVQFVQR